MSVAGSVLIVTFLVQSASLKEISKNCSDLRESFADAVSRFTACAVYNSRPITLCESCVDSYVDVVYSYKNMTELRENGTTCIDNYINKDRLQIVETMYTNSHALWHRAKCYECFQRENGRISPKRSNQTIQFNTYYNRLMTCRKKTKGNVTLLCSSCLTDYLILNNFYISISNENEKIGVCMDIVDMMNDTRIFWSEVCCQYREHQEYIFLVCTSFIFIATALFYGLGQLCTEKKSPTIIQQRRFAESLSQADSTK